MSESRRSFPLPLLVGDLRACMATDVKSMLSIQVPEPLPGIHFHTPFELCSIPSAEHPDRIRSWFREARALGGLLCIQELEHICNLHGERPDAVRVLCEELLTNRDILTVLTITPHRLEDFLRLDPGLAAKMTVIHVPQPNPGE